MVTRGGCPKVDHISWKPDLEFSSGLQHATLARAANTIESGRKRQL